MAVLAKSLVALCSNLVKLYLHGLRKGSRQQDETTISWPKISLGEYLVQDLAERSMVLGALISANLASLRTLLVQLKVRAQRREAHLVILFQVEKVLEDLERQTKIAAIG